MQGKCLTFSAGVSLFALSKAVLNISNFYFQIFFVYATMFFCCKLVLYDAFINLKSLISV